MIKSHIRGAGGVAASTLALLVAGAGMSAAQVIDLEGETVTIVHNASPGGATGLSSQILAEAWSQTMEGNPTIVVESVSGGALTRGINQVMNARPDGLTLGYLAWQGSTRILDPEELQIPFEDFGIIGGIGGANFFLHASAEAAEAREDFAELEEFSYGGFSPRSGPSMQTAGALDMLDIDWNFVSGFGGDGPLQAALQRGEIDGYPATAVVYSDQLRDGPIAEGESIGVWHYGFESEDGSGMEPDPVFNGEIPTFDAYYEELTGEAPSGPIWDMIQFHTRVTTPVNWLIVAPPETPQEHVEMLRESFREATQTDAYQEAAEQVFGGAPNLEYSDEMLAIVEEVQNTPQEMRDLMQEYLSRMEG